jgi:hypothetical protein
MLRAHPEVQTTGHSALSIGWNESTGIKFRLRGGYIQLEVNDLESQTESIKAIHRLRSLAGPTARAARPGLSSDDRRFRR